jgi:hypothetical protein
MRAATHASAAVTRCAGHPEMSLALMHTNVELCLRSLHVVELVDREACSSPSLRQNDDRLLKHLMGSVALTEDDACEKSLQLR